MKRFDRVRYVPVADEVWQASSCRILGAQDLPPGSTGHVISVRRKSQRAVVQFVLGDSRGARIVPLAALESAA
jgi:hypothetical protein